MEPVRSHTPIQTGPKPQSETIHAPWSEEQVAALNFFQGSGVFHPFTSENGRVLIATQNGWTEQENGPVVQTWAHSFMANQPEIEKRMAIFSRVQFDGTLPPLPDSTTPSYSRAEARRHYTHDERGFSILRCYVSEGQSPTDAREFHHEVIAHLSSGYHANIRAVGPDGKMTVHEWKATNLHLYFAFLPKLNPDGLLAPVSKNYLLPGSFLEEAKDLLLTFREKVQAGTSFSDAIKAVFEKAAEHGLEKFVSEKPPL